MRIKCNHRRKCPAQGLIHSKHPVTGVAERTEVSETRKDPPLTLRLRILQGMRNCRDNSQKSCFSHTQAAAPPVCSSCLMHALGSGPSHPRTPALIRSVAGGQTEGLGVGGENILLPSPLSLPRTA